MAKVQLDCEAFKRRSEKIIKALEGRADALLLALGRREEVPAYGINASLFLYLLGYEFPETVLILTRNGVTAVTSRKKGEILDQLRTHVQIKTVVQEKTEKTQEQTDEFLHKLVDEAAGSTGVLGVLPEAAPVPSIAEEFLRPSNSTQTTSQHAHALQSILSSLSLRGTRLCDVTREVEKVFESKEQIEISLLKKAGECAVGIAGLIESRIKYLVKTDDRATHEEVCEHVDSALEREIKGLRKEIDQSYMELCFSPVIQSGGQYRVETSPGGILFSPFRDQLLYFDVISYYLSAAYKGYCATLGRCLLVSPNEKAVRVLQACLSLLLDLVQELKTSPSFGSAEDAVRDKLGKYVEESEVPDLREHLVVEVGQSVGLRPREGPSDKRNEQPKDSTVFLLSVRFSDVPGLLTSEETGDTATIHAECVVLVTVDHSGTTEVSVLTPFSSDAKDYILERTEEKTKRTKLGRRLRNRDKEVERANEISEHQKQLMDELIEEQLEKYKGVVQNTSPETKEKEKVAVSYHKETQVLRSGVPKTHPSATHFTPQVVIDQRAASVVIPIFGVSVPFHITSIKSVTKSVEDGIGYLKIAFNTPVSPGPLTFSNFLVSLVLKDTQDSISDAWKDITEMKKAEKEPEEEEVEEGEQERLQMVPGRTDTLQNVYMRYDHRVSTRKTQPGAVEVHKNGIKYTTKTGTDTEILFSNIQHMFYQPGAPESPTLLHFHLRHSVTIGDKKTSDIQFFRDSTSSSVHDTRKSRGKTGEDAEMYEEEEEERVREEVNETFQEFANKLSKASRILLEEPLSKGFHGVTHRQSVLVQPTSECLVSLNEHPFFVLPLKEIELLNFERRVSGVTTCDMVFILKEKVPVYIHTVSSSDVPWLIDFFDSKNICFTETRVNIQWTNVLKSILSDPVAFYEGGAWAILQPTREEEEEPDNASDAVNLETTSEEDSADDWEGADDEDQEDDEEEEDDDDDESVISMATSTEEEEEEEEEKPPKKKQRK